MKFQTATACAVALATGIVAATPATSFAQTKAQLDHRQAMKNQWRNLGYLGGALAILGLTSNNSTLTTIGVVGGLYSASRYEQDRKSQSNMERARAQIFGRSSFFNDGHKYVRKTVTKNGKKYYTFVKAW